MKYELGLYIVLETSSSTRAELFSIQNGVSFDQIDMKAKVIFRQLKIRIIKQGLILRPRCGTADDTIPD